MIEADSLFFLFPLQIIKLNKKKLPSSPTLYAFFYFHFCRNSRNSFISFISFFHLSIYLSFSFTLGSLYVVGWNRIGCQSANLWLGSFRLLRPGNSGKSRLWIPVRKRGRRKEEEKKGKNMCVLVFLCDFLFRVVKQWR